MLAAKCRQCRVPPVLLFLRLNFRFRELGRDPSVNSGSWLLQEKQPTWLWEAEVPVSHPELQSFPFATQETGGAEAEQPRDRASPRHQSVKCRGAWNLSVPLHQPFSTQALTRLRLEKLSDHLLPPSLPGARLPSSAFLPSAPHPASQWTGTDLETPCLSRHRIPLGSMFFLLVSQTYSPVTSSCTPTFCPQDNQPDKTAPYSWECPSHIWTQLSLPFWLPRQASLSQAKYPHLFQSFFINAKGDNAYLDAWVRQLIAQLGQLGCDLHLWNFGQITLPL